MKNVIVTGANSGLGYETAKKIAADKDYRIIMACRNQQKAADAQAKMIAESGNQNIEVLPLDTSSLSSVAGFVDEFTKKYDKVVYKRRISSTESQALNIFEESASDGIKDSQVKKEIEYARDYYKDLAPRVLLSYERDAYYSTDDPNFRVTFDSNVLWRDTDVNLHTGIYGNPILPKGYVLMELKTAGGLPLWMTRILSEEKIYKTSFSKYGTAYKTILARDGKVRQFAYNYKLGMKGVFNYV